MKNIYEQVLFHYGIKVSPETQEGNWTYMKGPVDVQDVLWTSYVRSVYVLCPGVNCIRSSRPEVFCKKCVLKNFAKFTVKHLSGVCFLIKLQACNFIKKETLAQVFSCEFCETSKYTFSYRTPVAASVAPKIRFKFNEMNFMKSW